MTLKVLEKIDKLLKKCLRDSTQPYTTTSIGNKQYVTKFNTMVVKKL